MRLDLPINRFAAATLSAVTYGAPLNKTRTAVPAAMARSRRDIASDWTATAALTLKGWGVVISYLRLFVQHDYILSSVDGEVNTFLFHIAQ